MRWVRLLPIGLLCLLSSSMAGAEEPLSLDAFGLLVAQQSRPSFNIVGAGARAAGMGGAFTALADDASAASFNPAGLALLLRPEASVVVDGFRRDHGFEAFTAIEDDLTEIYGRSGSTFSTGGLNFASFTLPFEVLERNLTFQLSYHRIIDFTFRSDRSIEESVLGGGPLAHLDQQIHQDGSMATFSLAAGAQLTERLSLGLTLSHWSGAWDFDTSSLKTPIGESLSSFYRFDQSNSWSGWNVSAGFLLRYRYLDIGASFRSSFSGGYGVDSTLETSFESPFESESRFAGTLHWPSSYSIGIAVEPFETWIVSADYSESDWDEFVIRGLDEEPVNFFDLQPASESLTQNSAQLRLGTELTFFPGGDVMALRGGYFVEPKPQRLVAEEDPSPLRGFSLGWGWRHGGVSFDLAYQYSTTDAPVLEFVDPETVASGIVEAQALGHVDADEHRLVLSFLYQWESRASLHRLFRFLFVGPLDDDPPADETERAD